MKKKSLKNKDLFDRIESTNENNLINYYNKKKSDIVIIKSTYHNDITNSIVFDFINNLDLKLRKKTIVYEVPGSFEIPFIIKQILKKNNNKKDQISILAVGCIIKGQTKHDEYIASTIINALRNLSLEYDTLIINGILTTLNIKQAIERAGKKLRKGQEYAANLTNMLQLIEKIK